MIVRGHSLTRRIRIEHAALVVTALVAAACGSRTELLVPEENDAGPPDVQDELARDVAIEPDAAEEDAQPKDAVPDAPVTLNGAVRITAGSASSCAINAAGGVECWGEDFYGELGNGAMGMFNTPQQVVGLSSGVLAISADVFGVCAVTTMGTASCWGSNMYGQLGNGTFTTTGNAAAVTNVSTAVGVAGGGIYASCILLGTGTVECMGGDYDGNLALGSITSMTYDTPQTSKVTGAIALGGSGVGSSAPNCAILAGGSVQCWGFMQNSLGDGTTIASGAPFAVPGITNAVQVATSGANICIVLAGGALSCWGENLWGEVGDGTTTTRKTPVATTLTNVASVSIGNFHTCVVTGGSVTGSPRSSRRRRGKSRSAPVRSASHVATPTRAR
jgi:alpha-tubulin suppressor-like RCC1 family protein